MPSIVEIAAVVFVTSLRAKVSMRIKEMKNLISKSTYILFFATLLFPFTGYATNFTYNSVTICGPAGMKSWEKEKYPDITAYKYFYIHKSKDNKIIVWNNFYQFTNFKEISYEQLYIQNAGVTSLKFSTSEGVDKYVLTLRNESNSGRNVEKTLLVNLSSGTFISRVSGFEPVIGVCNGVDSVK